MGTFIICPFLREMMEASLMISAMFFCMDSFFFSRWRAASLSRLWESSHSCFLMAISLQFRNPNVEYRNPKQIRISKIQNVETPLSGTFEIWSFAIVSSFGFRASDLDPL